MTKRARPVALLLLLAGAPGLRADRAILAPEDAPRADASVLRALNAGEQTLDVIVGVRDGTPSAAALAAHPDPAGEPARRRRRLAAQAKLAESLPRRLADVRRRWAGFSALNARASREGILALARRSDVAWITLDGLRRAHTSGPQSGQRLIRSSDVNALGIDGAGQTIAVLDTGVDYTVEGLGGGGFPNAKVVAGADVADDDADPMDCMGHGTSVASVAAGPSGVAPGAKLVALKISPTAQCGTARDSDILEAFDWVLANREAYGIGVINLSFGGVAERSIGYCDSRLPHYATAVDAARAAGVAFVASAGNEGLTGSIGAPACLSTAISAGAVYPDRYSSVTWGDGAGSTFCVDEPAEPDALVCFSNGASGLAVLAPGAFWSVETLGGTVEQFHGTSAAAPAVAGTVALLRQGRPGLPPSAIASLLRATGRPVLDGRNGTLTPRIDALAALELPDAALARFDGTAVPIPDGFGAATAVAVAEGYSGRLAGVQAIVQLEHPDPRQLRVTLTGPDGTRVVLHDRSGSTDRPINAVYGRTLAPAGSLAAFQGKAANGAWTLTVEDATPTAGGSIRDFAVLLTAARPEERIPPGASTRVLPLVGRVQGTRFFLSDVRLHNPDPQPKALSLFYVSQATDGAHAVRSERTLAPGETVAVDDMVGSEFGYAESIGSLTLLAEDTRFLAVSRAYTRDARGTFGLFVPSFSSADAFGRGQTATANGLARGHGFHTNAGFTEVSGAPATVKLAILDPLGRTLAESTRFVAAHASAFVTDIAGQLGLTDASRFRIDTTVLEGAGRIVAFATLLDDATGDGVFAPALRPATSAEDVVIAQASHATGGSASLFRTDVHVTNLDAAPAAVTLSLIPRALTGVPKPPREHTLAPGETLQLPDVLASEFGLADPSAAGLRIRPAAPARLAVSSRTYVEKGGGTFGFAIPGLDASEAIGAGDGAATILGLDHSTAPRGVRSNFGFAEVAGAGAGVRVAALAADGSLLGTRLYAVPAGQSLQKSVGDLLPLGSASNVTLRLTVESGAGRVLAWGVAIDNASGDAVYIPAIK